MHVGWLSAVVWWVYSAGKRPASGQAGIDYCKGPSRKQTMVVLLLQAVCPPPTSTGLSVHVHACATRVSYLPFHPPKSDNNRMRARSLGLPQNKTPNVKEFSSQHDTDTGQPGTGQGTDAGRKRRRTRRDLHRPETERPLTPDGVSVETHGRRRGFGGEQRSSGSSTHPACPTA